MKHQVNNCAIASCKVFMMFNVLKQDFEEAETKTVLHII